MIICIFIFSAVLCTIAYGVIKTCEGVQNGIRYISKSKCNK